jgi:alpha-amylase
MEEWEMKKRVLALFLCVLMVSSVFYGCKKEKSQDTGKDTDSSQVEVNETEVTPAAESGESTEASVQTIEYKYEQDLNIISDNYRNYYEIFVYSFCDSDGDGIGDMNGIASKLDYISDMGFNGIWLMPIMPSPSYHKYDVTDYYTIDPKYGTLEDFKNLLAECEKRDIKLIIDFVFNHTSAKHPWFTDAVDYLEGLKEGEEPDLTKCPSVGYYHFTKETNGSDDYHKAGSSDWYYECVFWDQMPDLALESTELRTEIEKIAKYWLDMGVDGFRLDAAKEYYTGETSKNVEVLKWFSDYVTSVNPDAFIVAEVWDVNTVIADYYESGIPSIFNYPLAQYNGLVASTVRKLGTSTAKSFANTLVKLNQSYAEKNPDYIDSPFLSNHDNTRVSAQVANNENQMKMAAGLLFMMNGSPFVYYGEEIGMNSQGDKDENKRLPMHWSDTDTTGITTAPSGADEVEQVFAPLDEQLKDPLSIVNYYKRSLRIRNENPEIARGEMSVIEELTDKNVCVFKKVYEGNEIVIVSNISQDAATVDLKTAGYDSLGIRGYLTVDGSVVTLTDGVLNLPLYSIVILK